MDPGDIEFPPIDSPEFAAALLNDARAAFPQYYANATPLEVRLLDALVLGHAALTVISNFPRENIVEEMRITVERVGDSVDQLFAAARESLRQCTTFKTIAGSERKEIERLLFTVKMAVE